MEVYLVSVMDRPGVNPGAPGISCCLAPCWRQTFKLCERGGLSQPPAALCADGRERPSPSPGLACIQSPFFIQFCEGNH